MLRASLRIIVPVVLTQTVVGINSAHAQDPVVVAPPADSPLNELISGYYFRTSETKAMQDDEFLNPAMHWVDLGEALWSVVEGEASKSCQECHDAAEETMKGAGASYPKYHEPWGKLMNLEQRINLCRTENMQAPAWEWESEELLAMTTYVRHQSRGLPVKVGIDGPARAFFDTGKALYYRRHGLLDLSCAHCHEQNYGKHLRGDWLSQGHTNGFPAYRLPLSSVASVHGWFQICNIRIRATPYDFGADEYVNLELFTAWRGSGLPVETPAVR